MTRNSTPRDLALLGIPEDVAAPLAEYTERLNASIKREWERRGYHHEPPHIGVDPEATSAGRFVRIVQGDDDELTKLCSVHSFVEKATGRVIKPGGWKAPAKWSGKLASQYTLTDPEPLWEALKRPGAHYGGYLYRNTDLPVVE